MARSTWHPYGPDQAFGHQAARDEELLDAAVAGLEQQRRAQSPRAANKAQPDGERPLLPTSRGPIRGWAAADGLPVTTNVALDAAAGLLSEAD
ncbi:MAG: hypothetical protein JO085_07060 [Acidimicrobiia bacterium]|nr:hypothetical protein [Acidimicrobiia bacterium]